MNNALNGTSWGEVPSPGELKIPEFMDPEYIAKDQRFRRWIREAEEARLGAAKGREHRRCYHRFKRRIDATAATIMFCGGMTLLAFIGWLMK